MISLISFHNLSNCSPIAKTFSRPIVTQVAKLRAFYQAEDYHQDYLVHHPNQLYIVINDKPKVEALRKEFPDVYRN